MTHHRAVHSIRGAQRKNTPYKLHSRFISWNVFLFAQASSVLGYRFDRWRHALVQSLLRDPCHDIFSSYVIHFRGPLVLRIAKA